MRQLNRGKKAEKRCSVTISQHTGRNCGLYGLMALFQAEIGAVIPPSVALKKESPGIVPARLLPILACVAAAGSAQLRFPSVFMLRPDEAALAAELSPRFFQGRSRLLYSYGVRYTLSRPGSERLTPACVGPERMVTMAGKEARPVWPVLYSMLAGRGLIGALSDVPGRQISAPI